MATRRLLASGVICFGIAMAVGYLVLTAFLRMHAASAWPIVPGEIIESQLVEVTSSKGSGYIARIRYAYLMLEKLFVGETVRFGPVVVRRQEADLEAIPTGKQISIYVAPDNPGLSVLDRTTVSSAT